MVCSAHVHRDSHDLSYHRSPHLRMNQKQTGPCGTHQQNITRSTPRGPVQFQFIVIQPLTAMDCDCRNQQVSYEFLALSYKHTYVRQSLNKAFLNLVLQLTHKMADLAFVRTQMLSMSTNTHASLSHIGAHIRHKSTQTLTIYVSKSKHLDTRVLRRSIHQRSLANTNCLTSQFYFNSTQKYL